MAPMPRCQPPGLENKKRRDHSAAIAFDASSSSSPPLRTQCDDLFRPSSLEAIAFRAVQQAGINLSQLERFCCGELRRTALTHDQHRKRLACRLPGQTPNLLPFTDQQPGFQDRRIQRATDPADPVLAELNDRGACTGLTNGFLQEAIKVGRSALLGPEGDLHGA